MVAQHAQCAESASVDEAVLEFTARERMCVGPVRFWIRQKLTSKGRVTKDRQKEPDRFPDKFALLPPRITEESMDTVILESISEGSDQ